MFREESFSNYWKRFVIAELKTSVNCVLASNTLFIVGDKDSSETNSHKSSLKNFAVIYLPFYRFISFRDTLFVAMNRGFGSRFRFSELQKLILINSDFDCFFYSEFALNELLILLNNFRKKSFNHSKIPLQALDNNFWL